MYAIGTYGNIQDSIVKARVDLAYVVFLCAHFAVSIYVLLIRFIGYPESHLL